MLNVRYFPELNEEFTARLEWLSFAADILEGKKEK